MSTFRQLTLPCLLVKKSAEKTSIFVNWINVLKHWKFTVWAFTSCFSNILSNSLLTNILHFVVGVVQHFISFSSLLKLKFVMILWVPRPFLIYLSEGSNYCTIAVSTLKGSLKRAAKYQSCGSWLRCSSPCHAAAAGLFGHVSKLTLTIKSSRLDVMK